jgi:hypothetical protein
MATRTSSSSHGSFHANPVGHFFRITVSIDINGHRSDRSSSIVLQCHYPLCKRSDVCGARFKTVAGAQGVLPPKLR